VEQRLIALGTFLDIVGAFDRIPLDVTIKSDKQHGLGHTICQYVGCMTGSRKIYSHTGRRNSGGISGQGLSVGGHFMASFVESGCR